MMLSEKRWTLSDSHMQTGRAFITENLKSSTTSTTATSSSGCTTTLRISRLYRLSLASFRRSWSLPVGNQAVYLAIGLHDLKINKCKSTNAKFAHYYWPAATRIWSKCPKAETRKKKSAMVAMRWSLPIENANLCSRRVLSSKPLLWHGYYPFTMTSC